jgi:flavodoxin
MPDVLILYASTHGQTAKIATRIGGVVGASGATRSNGRASIMARGHHPTL